MTKNGADLVDWPLVVVIEDYYVPESARLVVEVAGEQSNETHAILWTLAGMQAKEKVSRN